MNIVLCGMMGVGKTSVGIRVSELTGRCWKDTDDMIVAKHGRIADIFEYYGEEYFRNVETQIVGEVSKEDNLVVSTGGGAVLRSENVALLKEDGSKIFYLRATAQTLADRVAGGSSNRPLIAKYADDGMMRRIESLLSVRAAIYEHVADVIVDTDGKSIDEVAQEIVAAFNA